MELTDRSRSLVVRVWEHGDDVVARLLVASDGATAPTVTLTGRAAILEWIETWLDHGSERDGDGTVTP